MQGQVSDPSPLVAEMEDVLLDWKVRVDKVAVQVAIIREGEETARRAREEAFRLEAEAAAARAAEVEAAAMRASVAVVRPGPLFIDVDAEEDAEEVEDATMVSARVFFFFESVR